MSTPEERLLARYGATTDVIDPAARLLEKYGVREQEEEDPEGNAVVSMAAGAARGLLDPFSILPPVDRVVEKLKRYGDDDTASKIGYGFGFLVGLAVPAAPAFRVGHSVARAAKLADKANDLTTAGRLVRGATAGALLSIGREADSVQEKVAQVALESALGGVGDTVIPPAFRALSARFGNKLDKDVLAVVRAIDEERAVTPRDEKAIAAHARAMMLADEYLAKTQPVAPELAPTKVRMRKVKREDVKRMVGKSIELDPYTARPGTVVTSSDVPEEIVAPAWRSRRDKRVISNEGRTHGEVQELAIQRGEAVREDFPIGEVFQRYDDGITGYGFLTSRGRFVEQPEAAAISKAAKQVRRDRARDYDLWSEDLKNFGAQRAVVDPMQVDAVSATVQPDVVAKRLKLRLGLESLGLAKLRPGQMRIVPALGGDSGAVAEILDNVDEVRYAKVTRDDGTTDFIVGLSDTFEKRIADTYRKNGFIPGQDVLWNGKKWTVLKKADTGTGLWLGDAAGHKRFAKWNEMQLLPVATDVLGPKLHRQPARLWGEFVYEHGIFPGTRGFIDLFDEYAAKNGIHGKARLQLLSYFTKKQKEALRDVLDDDFVVLETMEKEAARLGSLANADGEFATLLASKGLTFVQHRASGQRGIEIKNALGATISPKFSNEQAAILWLQKYGVEPDDVLPGVQSPLAPDALPAVGVSYTPPHTAGEFSNYSGSPLLNFLEPVLPRHAWLQFIENQLRKQLGTNFDQTKHGVWSQAFEPLQRALALSRNETQLWLRGGKAQDGTRVKGLAEIVGGPKQKNIRKDKREAVVDLLESPRAEWTKRAAELGLNEREVRVAQELREFYNQAWRRWVQDAEIDISADDFLEDYFPHFRGKSDSEMRNAIENSVVKKNKIYNGKVIDFMSEFSRKGLLKKWEKDPFVVTAAYLRSGIYKSQVRAAHEQATKFLEQLAKNPELRNKEANQIVASLNSYLKLVSYGSPEAWAAIDAATEGVLKRAGIKLDPDTKDRVVDTLVTMNYGAYMGFRPGLAIRNLSQTLLTTYPLLGGRYTRHGFKAMFGNSEAARAELLETGAIVEGALPVPFEDVVYLQASRQSAQKALGGSIELARKIGHAASRATDTGLRVALFNKADEINRGIAYFGQKQKVLDAANDLLSKKISLEEFHSKSGLNYYGETVKAQYHQILEGKGNLEAAKWLGAQAAHDTQWLYQLGSGPRMFSHGFGRLFGQYGTWPSWYLAFNLRAMSKGVTSMSGRDRAAFLARSVLAHNAIVLTGAAMGLNLTRWTGISSLSWMGGPAVDWFSDFREVVTGVMPSGEASAQRSIALAGYGLQDTGEISKPANLPAPIGRIGLAEGDQRWRLLEFFGAYTPGYLALKDFRDAMGADSPWEAAAEALNLPRETLGHEWPEIKMGR